MKDKDERDVPVPEWRPVRPFTNFPPIEPQPFDTRDSTYIPDLSVGDPKVAKMSVRKLRGVGIKIYRSAAQTINDITEDDIVYDTISWQRGMDTHPQSSSALLVPHTGVYLISVVNAWNTGTGYARTSIALNGISVEYMATTTTGAPAFNNLSVVNNYDAGDMIEVYGYHVTGGTRDISGGEQYNSLSAVMLFSL